MKAVFMYEIVLKNTTTNEEKTRDLTYEKTFNNYRINMC